MSPLLMLKRRYKTILLVVLLIIGWFALEAAYMPLPAGDAEIKTLNQVYSTQYESVEAFQFHLGTVIFEKIPWDASSVSLFLPLLAVLVISTCFSSRSVELSVSRGKSKTRLFILLTVWFYAVVWLMHGITLMLHLIRAGRTALLHMDWKLFLRVWALRSLYICAWLSPTVLIAFVVQHPFLTTVFNYGYLFAGVIFSRLAAVNLLFPISYITRRNVWQSPYDTQLAAQGVLVSVIWLVVFSLLTYVLFRRRDIAQ